MRLEDLTDIPGAGIYSSERTLLKLTKVPHLSWEAVRIRLIIPPQQYLIGPVLPPDLANSHLAYLPAKPQFRRPLR